MTEKTLGSSRDLVSKREGDLPCQEKRLVELVDEIEDDVVIRHHIKSRTRKLTINEDHLQNQTPKI